MSKLTPVTMPVQLWRHGQLCAVEQSNAQANAAALVAAPALTGATGAPLTATSTHPGVQAGDATVAVAFTMASAMSAQ